MKKAIKLFIDFVLRIVKKMTSFMISRFIPVCSKRIALIYTSTSGSNTVALHKFASNEVKKKYDIRLVRIGNKNSVREYLHRTITLASSSALISTHGGMRPKRNQVWIELWHGLALKGVGLMEPSLSTESKQRESTIWKNVDRIISCSPMYNTIMNSCIGVDVNKYKVTGLPRNDFLFCDNGKKLIKKFVNINIEKKIVLFMPTFREVDIDKKEFQRNNNHNFFGFSSFDNKKFSTFLENNNLEIVVKLHPNDEKIIIENVLINSGNHIHLITSEMLENAYIDLYELMGCADVLITDYSSVYFDFLLLNRPIIFLPVDIMLYRKKRSFLLEPYDFWTPGPKVYDQESLERELEACIFDPYYYQMQRVVLSNIIHVFQDENSSQRVWNLIEQQLNN